MDLLEIKLKNPIGLDEVIRLKSELTSAKKHDFLIIDAGAYDFESTKVLNRFKNQLSDLAPCLTKFKTNQKMKIVHGKPEIPPPLRYHVHRYCWLHCFDATR